MNYEIHFDEEAGAVYLKIINMLNAGDVSEMMPGIDKLLDGKNPRHVIVDLKANPPGSLDKPARKAFKSFFEAFEFDKIAMFGAEPRIRMMAKAAIFALGRSKVTRFYNNKAEALAWLKGD